MDVKSQPVGSWSVSLDANPIIASLTEAHTVMVDSLDNNDIIMLSYPDIILLYSSNGTIDGHQLYSHQLYSQPLLPAKMRSAITKLIQQSLTAVAMMATSLPLPHSQTTLRLSYQLTRTSIIPCLMTLLTSPTSTYCNN